MKHTSKLMRGVFLAPALLTAMPLVALPASFAVLGATAAHAQEKLVAAVLFKGNSGFSDAQLLDLVNVGTRGTYSAASLANDAESIRIAYVNKGYVGVTVTPQVEASSSGRSVITFVVNEGSRSGIAAINFTGNNAINSGTLKSVVRTRETGLLSWLFRDDSYNEDQIAIDRQLIENYYANNGYPDARVTSAVGEYDASRNAYFVNFSINEGERYNFGSVNVETSIPGLDANELASVIRTRQGGRYSLLELQRTQQDMAYAATVQGYAFADVRPRIDRDLGNGTFNVTYLVDEGARVYVERINITGNDKTRDAVIRREFSFGEGDPFNRSMLDRSKTAVEGLGFFKSVDVALSQGSAADKVVVNVTVVEQSTGDYGVSAGYASDSGLLGELSVTERNFLGRGQYVKASIGASQSGQSYDFSFTEPRFMGLRISSGFDVYHKITDETSGNVYGTTSTGGQLRLGMPITRDLSASVFLGVEQKKVIDEEDPTSEVIQVATKDTFSKAWVGYSLSYNTLDSQKRPTSGVLASFTQQYLGWDYNLIKTEAKARYFIPLMEDAGVIGSIKGQAGIINSLDGGDVHPLESFGYSGALVRGFNSRGLGPRATGGEYLGYTAYVGASAEIEFPIPVLPETYGIRGSVWADAALIDGAGTANGVLPSGGTIDDNFKASVGASVIWDSPFGPLRGDFAYVLNKATEDKTQVFQLTIQQLL